MFFIYLLGIQSIEEEIGLVCTKQQDYMTSSDERGIYAASEFVIPNKKSSISFVPQIPEDKWVNS